jgi:hypothetical protein
MYKSPDTVLPRLIGNRSRPAVTWEKGNQHSVRLYMQRPGFGVSRYFRRITELN